MGGEKEKVEIGRVKVEGRRKGERDGLDLMR
jgi:hypothetical protein